MSEIFIQGKDGCIKLTVETRHAENMKATVSSCKKILYIIYVYKHSFHKTKILIIHYHSKVYGIGNIFNVSYAQSAAII